VSGYIEIDFIENDMALMNAPKQKRCGRFTNVFLNLLIN
jgi:hypothetical protein